MAKFGEMTGNDKTVLDLILSVGHQNQMLLFVDGVALGEDRGSAWSCCWLANQEEARC